eukprot:PhF_6_TR30726/c0_g1_i1/m.45217
MDYDTIAHFAFMFVLFRAAGNAPYAIPLIYFATHFPAHLWESLIESSSKMFLIIGVTNIVFFSTYWIHGMPYVAMDLTQQPSFLTKYKIQKTRHLVLEKVWPVFKTITLQQLYLLVPFTYVAYRIDRVTITETLPSSTEMLHHFLFYTFVEEFAFYYSHRLLHTDYFYTRVHKKHHEFQSPSTITAAYAHPLEMFLSNIFPVALGPIILQSHLYTFYLWHVFAIIATQVGHSGYSFPWQTASDAKFHDLHHEKFKFNYGLGLGLLDRFHGTMRNPDTQNK